ncbi:MAG TPA: hypothetical protein ENK91_16285, partial [Bacteroidetes bacterium]|nr:hypothetical protein [Bacteroidota bacterium]
MKKKQNIYSYLLDIYLYSSVHIALAASCFVLQTYFILNLNINLQYVLFVFSGTLFLYVLHNFKGSNYFASEVPREKMEIISRMKKFLYSALVFSIIIQIYSFVHLKIHTIIYLFIMGFISIWYVIPIFGNNKRLRDYSFIKIFLIALVWAFLSVWIPLIDTEISIYTKALIFLQNYLFIFALTIPFDIRDYEYEKKLGLKTIPSVLGKRRSINLAVLLILIDVLIVLILKDVYGLKYSLGLIFGYLITIVAIKYSINKTNDQYFTGLLD